jgi:regulator of protease activity HflC (stomatin/prohibitin superfamily)
MFDRLFDFIFDILKLFKFCKILQPQQRGVRVRLGLKIKKIGPGFHLYLPFGLDTLYWENVMTETMTTNPQSLTTSDGISVAISSVITFSIFDVKIFLLEVEGRNAVIGDTAYGVTADFIRSKTWNELNDPKFNLSFEMTQAIRNQAEKYGVKIISVKPVDFQKCEAIRILGKPIWVDVR